MAAHFLLAFVVPSISTFKPNVLVFFADDLGIGDLAVYGHPTTSTPSTPLLPARMFFKNTPALTDGHLAHPVIRPR